VVYCRVRRPGGGPFAAPRGRPRGAGATCVDDESVAVADGHSVASGNPRAAMIQGEARDG
jgi:hypothetical protein